MIPITRTTVNENSGIEKIVDFNAKVSNLGGLFEILRNQLYSDPILAVIREYSCNSADAHVAAGKKDEKIVVTFPTPLDCFFKVRDFGTGLTDEEVGEIFASYGESTKRQTQDATGMLGIGCKSGFAYNDSFMVHSIKNGIMSIWNAFIDPSKKGAMAKMGACETTEPDGIEIVIPVKQNDIPKFIDKALNFFKFWENPPKLENLEDYREAEFTNMLNFKSSAILQGDGWSYYGHGGQSYAIMGKIAYPIDLAVFGDIDRQLLEIMSGGAILNFKIGELEFAASREALQYTSVTKAALLAGMEKMNKEIVAKMEDSFVNCKTLWDAKILHASLFHDSGKFYKLRSLMGKLKVKFQGKDVTSEYFSTSYTSDVSVSLYKKRNDFGNERVHRDNVTMIVASPHNLVVENDKRAINGILNRVLGLIENGTYKRVYVVTFKDDAVKQEFLDKTSFDGPVTLLSTLPKEPISKYYPDVANRGVNGFGNKKHLAQEFTLNTNNYRSGSMASSAWTQATVDLAKDSGVYLAIERFQYKTPSGGFNHPRHLNECFMHLRALGIDLPVIYGFKEKSVKAVQNNPNMVEFHVWYAAEFKKFYTATVAQDYANFLFANSSRLGTGLTYALKDVSGLTTNQQSPLRVWLEALNAEIQPKHVNINGANTPISSIADSLHYFINHCGLKVPANNFVEFNKMPSLKQRYPLFFLSVDALGYRVNQHVSDFSEYIDLIDLSKP